MSTEVLVRQIVSVKPIVVPTSDRPFPLTVKVTGAGNALERAVREVGSLASL